MKVSNEEVRKRTRSERISTQIKTRRWRWISHVLTSVLRMKPDSLPRIALTWAPEGKRKRGLPREPGEEQLKERDVKRGSKHGQRQPE